MSNPSINPIYIIGGVLVIVLIWGVLTYNGLVAQSAAVDGQWAQVQTAYQRRADLIPNLVSSVNKYMRYEGGLLENITALRSQWANAKTPEDQIAAGSAMDSAISRLLVVSENYPDLKADTSVSKLMDELAGSENRISVERMRYNDAVKSYNVAIHTLPTNIVAGMMGLKDRPYFQASAEAQKVPVVNDSVPGMQ